MSNQEFERVVEEQKPVTGKGIDFKNYVWQAIQMENLIRDAVRIFHAAANPGILKEKP